jgi:hypothetical protein
VLHSQSGAPTEGPSESSNSSVPPEAPPAQSDSPSKGSAKNPSNPPSEAPPTPSNAPPEAPLISDVSAATHLGDAPLPVRAVPPSASSNSRNVFFTNNPSSSPGHQIHAYISAFAVNVKSCRLPALSQDASEHSANLALQKLIYTAADAYQSAANWAEFVAQCRDAHGDLHPGVGDLSHRAAHLLDQLCHHGAPVGMKTKLWDDKKKRDALQRGSHQYALKHKSFLCEEFVDLILKGQ